MGRCTVINAPPPSATGEHYWPFCDDPNCNHTSHGSLTKVVRIMLGIQARVRREQPEKWAQWVAQAEAARREKEARRNAAAASHAG